MTLIHLESSMKIVLKGLGLTFDYITSFTLLLEPGKEVAVDISGIVVVAIFILFAFFHVASQFIVHASFFDHVHIQTWVELR